ncbi:MAG: acetate/propionate family kinase [Gammaproteobacteria bacterium]|nr:acetate/propionate family kinase [Gammaproteobacteria bacterium]
MEPRKSLIINIGSSSKRYAFYSNEKLLGQFYFEKNPDTISLTIEIGDSKNKTQITPSDYETAIKTVSETLIAKKLIVNNSEITAIGIRIVAPGTYFTAHKLINDEYIKRLEHMKQYAPLHIAPILDELKQLQIHFKNIPLIGISDSAFHAEMPEYARRYSLPKNFASQFDIYRFGYHGISLASIMIKIEEIFSVIPERIIICHLGSGASITAIKAGKSVDTSMGFTPLEGLPMGTRIGTIDAAAILYLIEQGLTSSELKEFLNNQCGLLGFSGKTADVRTLIAAEERGDSDAHFSLEASLYWIKKYIGAYSAVMGGIDLVVFTGAIGERSPLIRSRICRNLSYISISIDEAENMKMIQHDGFIHASHASVKIAVLMTEEQKEMAKIVLLLLAKNEER